MGLVDDARNRNHSLRRGETSDWSRPITSQTILIGEPTDDSVVPLRCEVETCAQELLNAGEEFLCLEISLRLLSATNIVDSPAR